MPLTETQIENIDTKLNEQELLIGDIISARDDLRALCRIHANVPNTTCTAVIQDAKARAKAAADALSESLA